MKQKPAGRADTETIENWLLARDIKPAVPLKWWLAGEVQSLTEKVNIWTGNAARSTKERREMRAELEALHRALDSLSHDTRLTLRDFLCFASLSARGEQDEGTDFREPEVVAEAARMALQAIEARPDDRGRGKAARIRRLFVREAARLFVWAGGETLSASRGAHFREWCGMLGNVCGLPDAEIGLQRAILDEIGDTAKARDAHRRRVVRHMRDVWRRHLEKRTRPAR